MGFDGLLRTRAAVLLGILNGIDETVWNPAADPFIAAGFSPSRLGRRAANKAALQARLGLTASPEALLFGVISRLTWQKGLDLLLADLPGAARAGRPVRFARQRRALARGRVRRRRRRPSRAGRLLSSAMTRRWRTRSRRGRTRW